MDKELLKGIISRSLTRFIKSGITSAIAAMVIITPNNVNNWNDIWGWLSSLLFAATVGFITGGLLGLDKLYRDLFPKEK